LRQADCITRRSGLGVRADRDANAAATDRDAFGSSDDHAFGHASTIAARHANASPISDCDASSLPIGCADLDSDEFAMRQF
jgi:hypothetical protein